MPMGLFIQVKGALECYIAEVENFPVESNCGIMKSLLLFCTQNQSLLDSHKVFLLRKYAMNLNFGSSEHRLWSDLIMRMMWFLC